MIEVTVKTLDGQNRSFVVPDLITVQNFKERIANSINISAVDQRLIFRGRVLQNDKQLNEYEVVGKVVHVVQRPPPSNTSQGPVSQPSTSNDMPNPGATRNLNGSALVVTSFPMDPQQVQNIVQQTLSGMGEVGDSAQVTANTAADGTPGVDVQISLGLPSSHQEAHNRLSTARRMVNSARRILQRLENPQASNDVSPNNEAEASELTESHVTAGPVPDTTEAPLNQFVNGGSQEDVPDVVMENANSSAPTMEDIGNDSEDMAEGIPAGSVGAQTETLEVAEENVHGTNQRNESSEHQDQNCILSRTYAEMLSDISDIHVRLQPFLEQTRGLLNVSTSESENSASNLSVFNQVSRILHSLSHAYHSLSDLSLGTNAGVPTLHAGHMRARPVIQQNIPVQASLNISPVIARMSTGPVSQAPSSTSTSSTSTTSSHSANTRQRSSASADRTEANNPVTASASVAGAVPQFHFPQMRFLHPPIIRGANVAQTQAGLQALPQQISSAIQVAMSQVPGMPPISLPGTFSNSNTSATTSSSSNSTPQTRASSTTSASTSSASGLGAASFGVFFSSNGTAFSNSLSFSNASSRNTRTTSMGTTTSTRTRSSASPDVATTTTSANTQPRLFPMPSALRQPFDPYLPCVSRHFPRLAHHHRVHIRPPVGGVAESVVDREIAGFVRDAISQADGGTSENTTAAEAGTGDRATPGGITDETFAAMIGGIDHSFSQISQGNTDQTIGNFLNRFTSQHNISLGEGTLADLFEMLTSRLTFVDLMGIMCGQSAPLQNLHAPLRGFIINRMLQDGDVSDVGIDNAVNSLLDENVNFIQETSAGVNVKDNIDYQATIHAFLHHQLTIILKLIVITPENDATFGQKLYDGVQRGIYDFAALNRRILVGGDDALEDLVVRFYGMRDQLTSPVVHSWMTEMSRQHLRRILPDVPVDTDYLSEFVRHIPSSPVDSTSSASYMSAESVPEAHCLSEGINDDVMDVGTKLEELKAKLPPPPPSEPEITVNIGSEDWHSSVPEEWIPVMTADKVRQSRMSIQRPLSDAYLSGLPAKRRKVTQSQSNGHTSEMATVVPSVLQEAVNSVKVQPVTETSALVKDAASNTALHQAFQSHVLQNALSAVGNNPDFIEDKYPNTKKMLDQMKKN